MSDRPTSYAVLDHLAWMRVRGLSPLTVRARRGVLAGLAAFTGSPPLTADAAQVQAWQLRRSCDVGDPTRRNDLSHARAFYRWAVRTGLREDDPTEGLVPPRAPRRQPRPITDRSLLAALDSAGADTAVLLGLAGFAGLRAVEIARLDWSEVVLLDARPRLYVTAGKGGHGRVVPISAALAALLERLPHRRGPVLRRLDGRPGQNSSNAVTHRASRHLAACGITASLHQLRHRFGSAAYQGSRDLRAVQELLGHASPTTTAVYAAASSAAVAQAVAAAGVLHTTSARP